MLGVSWSQSASAVVALAVSAVGCADLIGLNDLDGPGGSGGSTGSGGSDSGSGGEGLGGALDCSLDTFGSRAFTDACWHSFNTDLLWGGDYTFDDGGGLVTTPEKGHGWFGGDSAFLLYREITGDFRLDIVLSVLEGSSGRVKPFWPYVSGGILAFPANVGLDDIEEGLFVDYYAIKAGTLGEDANGDAVPGLVTAYTDENTVTWPTERPESASWDETGLRMCRFGNILWTGFRTEPGIAWTPLHPADQANGFDTTDDELPELADTMYVGLLSEILDIDASDGAARIIYSRADFTVPESFEDCTR